MTMAIDLEPSSASRPFIVGAIGALITAVKFTPGASWPERLVNVCAGSAAAGFITPALTEWLHMTSAAQQNGAAFLFGLVGMSLAAAALQAIKDTAWGQIVASWLTRRG
jgi:hypothetical protein